MVDFRKLNDPVEKEKRRKERLEMDRRATEREKANRFMVAKLNELLENDKIQDAYDRSFIRSVNYRVNAGLPLTDKQETYLEKCFHHKY